MGKLFSKAITFVTGPASRYRLLWNVAPPLLVATLVTGAVRFFSDWTWAWPERQFFKETFAWEGPLLLVVGAIAQAVLTSFRSKAKSTAATPAVPPVHAATSAKRLDRLDLGGWGFVVIGALLSLLAALL
jgi:hypothetical protein